MQAAPVADQRILRGVAATLSYQFLDADGNVAAPAGTVTVGVTKADGTVLVAAGTATSGATTAPRTYALAAVNTLELLTVTWTDAGDASTQVQLVEVVGGYFFSATQARAAETAIADGNTYTTVQVVAARREVEDECEQICGVAFVPRYRRAVLDGTGDSCLILPDARPRTVRSVRVYSSATGYTAFTSDELAALSLDRSGRIDRLYGQLFVCGTGNVIVEYEHGYDRPPADLVKASIIRLRHRLNMTRSAIPDRAERFLQGDGVTFVLAMPGPWRTGVPEVDAVYQRYSLLPDRVAFG